MSHTIKITRTITTTTTMGTGGSVNVNAEYVKKVPGILQLMEWIIGAIIVALCTAGGYASNNYNYTYDAFVCLNNGDLFLLNIAIACLITTLLMFVAKLFHQSTAEALPKTLFELLYHCIAFLLYLTGAITVMVAVNQDRYGGTRYTVLLVAAILALVNTILYLVSFIYSLKAFKGEKMQGA